MLVGKIFYQLPVDSAGPVESAVPSSGPTSVQINNKVQLGYLRHAVIAEVMNMFQAKCELFQNQHCCLVYLFCLLALELQSDSIIGILFHLYAI